MLHGHGGSSNQSIGLNLTKAPQKVWLNLAEDNDFIVIAPNGVIGPDGKRGWNDCRSDDISNPDTDDVKFINELINKIQQEFNHNDKRVYVSGVSNGASMSIRLAQEIPEKITAFASIVSQMPVNSECVDSNVPISALFMNGTDDPFVPYVGGGYQILIEVKFNQRMKASTIGLLEITLIV